ncbi:MAG: class I SAM-dependent methyltransferase [Clostridiales bacterium]|jgi:SAM-dependent methyltransferase|nr:class I SAM-dependent methyltransferase [Clostridiales bacterium]
MNEEKFTGKADIYMKFRPSYPESFINYLYTDVGFQESSTIADIGAGTGKLSKLLAERGSRVICVEPNKEMLTKARQNLEGFTNCLFINTSAEGINLGGSSIDFITVAQAFHWFDRLKFKAECKRLLKVGGKVVIVYNSSDLPEGMGQEYKNISEKLCQGFNGLSSGPKFGPDAYLDFFKEGGCDFKVFENKLSYDEESFVGRNLSRSYSPKEGSPDYTEFVKECRALFNKYSTDGLIEVTAATTCYTGEV